MEQNKYTVQTSLKPFSTRFDTIVGLDECKTLQDVVNKTIPYNFKDCTLFTIVNGCIIDPDGRKDFILHEGDIIGLNFIPTGGGGGNKGVQIGIMVAAAFAAAVLGPMAFAAAAQWGAAAVGGTFAASAGGAVVATGAAYGIGLMAQGLTYIAISMVASLALSALTSTPKQSRNTDEGMKSISSSNNSVDQYGIVPINLGTNRMFPKQAALPYQEIVGRDTYCRQLFTYGYGKLKIEERKLGETLLNEYDDIELDDRLNADLHDRVKLYSNDTYTEAFSIKMTYDLGNVIRSTRNNTDELNITFTMPYGLYDQWGKNDDRFGPDTVTFKIAYRVSGTENWIHEENYTIEDYYKSSFSVVKNIKFPTRAKYDVLIRRLTADYDGESHRKDTQLTGFTSITYTNPVKLKNISGTAIRIKATDQLNGTIDSYNAIVSTYLTGYDPTIDGWLPDKISSNPADIFRYVLQSPAFAKSLSDDKIDLVKLVEWWKYCDSLKLTYDRIIDYDTSIDDVLNDICAAGMATLSKVDNIYSVIIDNERPVIKGVVTPRNSWDYKGNINYPEIPHGLRVEFRNKDAGYETDERLVFSDGYDEENASLYERIQFQSCTNADLAYWYGRRYYATAILQPETHSFQMDFESMTFNRGDRITLVNDVILVGVGQGRIKELIVDDIDNPTIVKGFITDEELNVPQAINLAVRIRNNNGSGTRYHLLEPAVGINNEFTFAESIPYVEAPNIGSLCAFVEDGKELDLIITQIIPNKNQSATITAVDYAPARFTPLEDIPEFKSNITLSYDFFKPQAPILNGEIKSDETVMLKNADGSVTSVMVIPLKNVNENDVIPVISVRYSGGKNWFTPSNLKRDATEVVLTGLDDGEYYDIQIRYQRQSGSQLLSDALELNHIKYVGGSTPPADVKGFKVTIASGLGLFSWIPNEEPDISHYVIKFTTDEDIAWETAQTAISRVTSNTVTSTIHIGNYLIKAVDLTGNESENFAVIKSDIAGGWKNVVEKLDQHPAWLGHKDGFMIIQDNLLTLAPHLDGYYYFDPEYLDLGDIYECFLTSNVKVRVRNRKYVREFPEMRDVGPLRDFSNRIRPIESIRSLESIRNFEKLDWGIQFEMSFSEDGIEWSDWEPFVSSERTFRYCKFRMYGYIERYQMIIDVIEASISVDMPDRYESDEDAQIRDANRGLTITYATPFWNNPSVNVTLQEGLADDRLEFLNKDNYGFTLRVFNDTLNTYVTRSFDWIAAGYGRRTEQ